MGSGAKRKVSARSGEFRSRVQHYLYSGDTKHVLAGVAIITLVFGVPWFLLNRGSGGSGKFESLYSFPCWVVATLLLHFVIFFLNKRCMASKRGYKFYFFFALSIAKMNYVYG